MRYWTVPGCLCQSETGRHVPLPSGDVRPPFLPRGYILYIYIYMSGSLMVSRPALGDYVWPCPFLPAGTINLQGSPRAPFLCQDHRAGTTTPAMVRRGCHHKPPRLMTGTRAATTVSNGTGTTTVPAMVTGDGTGTATVPAVTGGRSAGDPAAAMAGGGSGRSSGSASAARGGEAAGQILSAGRHRAKAEVSREAPSSVGGRGRHSSIYLCAAAALVHPCAVAGGCPPG